MREMDSENKDNQSEAPELPPGWTVFEAKIGTDRWRVCCHPFGCVASRDLDGDGDGSVIAFCAEVAP